MLRLFLRDGTETVPYSFNINSSLPTVGASIACPLSGRRGCRFLQYIIPCLVDVFGIAHLRSLTFAYVRLRSLTFVTKKKTNTNTNTKKNTKNKTKKNTKKIYLLSGVTRLCIAC